MGIWGHVNLRLPHWYGWTIQENVRHAKDVQDAFLLAYAVGVFLCVSSTVPLFVSISLSVPRVRMHRHFPP